jgi:hypothetical protein
MDQVDHVSIVATTLGGDEVFRGPVARVGDTADGGQVTFEAPAGPLRVRITPENSRGVRLDSDEAALEVPDFTGTGPRLTTPLTSSARQVCAWTQSTPPRTPASSASLGRHVFGGRTGQIMNARGGRAA